MNYYGIDVSQSSLQIAHQSIDGIWHETKVSNELGPINEWLSTMDIGQSFFILEYTGNYSARLSYCLNLIESSFSILSPSQSKGFSLTLKSTCKTDKQDARMLALYGSKMQPAPTVLADESLVQKRQKYKHLAILKAEKQAFSNRLHALSYLPNPSQIVQESTTSIIAFFEQEIQKLTQEVFTLDDDDFERILKIMTQVVGIGQITANALIVATNGFKDFENAKQVAKFVGVAPSDKQSGTSLKSKGSICKSACASVRTTLYMAAHSASRYNHACKAIFTRLRAKGKPHKVAIIAVINKLIKQLFAVVKNNTQFDNNLAITK